MRLQIQFKADTSFEGGSGVRDERGRFVAGDAQARLRELNHQGAVRVQADVVETIENRIERRPVSTKRLSRVTADQRNRYVTAFGFGVGVEEFLDRSEAKYWRQIEEGTSIHVGRMITGIWGRSRAGSYTNRWGTVLRGGEPYSHHGEDAQGKFVPLGKRQYLASGSRFLRGRQATIKKPIAPMEAYASALRGDTMTKHVNETAQVFLAAVLERGFMFTSD